MPNNSLHSSSARPAARALLHAILGAALSLSLPLSAFAAPVPSPALSRGAPASPAPFNILSVDSAVIQSPTVFAIGSTLSTFPGDLPPADSASRRFTVRWYANPQSPLPAVLLLEFATPASPGVIRSRTRRLDPKATGFQSASFDVPYPDAVYWQASILSGGRLLSRLQSPNWYEIRNP